MQPERLDLLCAVLARSRWANRACVIALGPPPRTLTRRLAVKRVVASYWPAPLAAAALVRAVQIDAGFALHAWSPGAVRVCDLALRWGLRFGFRPAVVVVDVSAPRDAPGAAAAGRAAGNSLVRRFVCASEAVRRGLEAAGVPREGCVVIPALPDAEDALGPGRPAVRQRMGLGPRDVAVLLLPPVRPETGAFYAAWATLVVSKVRADVRLIVPGAGREVRRIEALLRSCGMSGVARFVGDQEESAALLAAADLALYLPAGDAPLGGVLRAMAAGVPIVASRGSAVMELLAEGRNAWLCAPGSPKAAAARMLQALEDADEARRRAEAGRIDARQRFSRTRMLEEFDGLQAIGTL